MRQRRRRKRRRKGRATGRGTLSGRYERCKNDYFLAIDSAFMPLRRGMRRIQVKTLKKTIGFEERGERRTKDKLRWARARASSGERRGERRGEEMTSERKKVEKTIGR